MVVPNPVSIHTVIQAVLRHNCPSLRNELVQCDRASVEITIEILDYRIACRRGPERGNSPVSFESPGSQESRPAESLIPRLTAITGSNPDALLYVRGDKAINYGRVLEVMSLVSSAGFRKVSLIAESPKGVASAKPAAGATPSDRSRTVKR